MAVLAFGTKPRQPPHESILLRLSRPMCDPNEYAASTACAFAWYKGLSALEPWACRDQIRASTHPRETPILLWQRHTYRVECGAVDIVGDEALRVLAQVQVGQPLRHGRDIPVLQSVQRQEQIR